MTMWLVSVAQAGLNIAGQGVDVRDAAVVELETRAGRSSRRWR